MKIVKSEQNYIVECDEAEWYGKTPEVRDTLLEGFRTDAGGLNCRQVTVFVNPDPILPVHGIDRRTRVHSEKLASDQPYEICLTYSAELASAAWDAMEQKDRDKLLREIVDSLAKKGHKNPGRYEIYVVRAGSNGGADVREYLQRGRV